MVVISYRFQKLALLLLVVGLLGQAGVANAQLYWDINGATAGAGGATPSGTWDTTTANWNSSSAGTNAATVWTGFNNAFFSAGNDATGTFGVAVSGTQSLNNLTIEEGTVSFNGGTLQFGSPGGGPSISVASGLTTTINSSITRAGSGQVYLNKRDAGTLILTGGGTQQGLGVYQGTLQVTGGSYTFANDAYIGSLGGAACCNVTDAAANGAMTVNGGTIAFNGGNFIVGQSVNGAVVSQYTQTAGAVSTTGSFVGIGNGGGVSQLDISGGTFTTSASMNLGVRGNSTLNVSGTAVVTLPGLIFGHGSTGGANNTVNLNGGTLAVNAVSEGSGTSTFNFNGGTLQARSATTTFMQGLDRANVRNGAAIIDTNGFNVTIAQQLQHSNIGGDNATDGGLIKNGTGTLTLTANNTFNGGTVVNTGELSLNAGNGNRGAGTGQLTINSGGTVTAVNGTGGSGHNQFGNYGAGTTIPIFINGGTLNPSEYNHMTTLSMTGGIINAGGSTGGDGLDFNTSNSVAPSITTNASSNQATIAAKTTLRTATAFNVANGGAATDLLFSGQIVGAGSLTKTGAGLMSMTADNTYTGTTTISGGTLEFSTPSFNTYRGSTITIEGASTMSVVTTGGSNRYDFQSKTIQWNSVGGGTLALGNNINFVMDTASSGTSIFRTNGGAQNSIVGPGGINTGNFGHIINFDIAPGTGATDLLVSAPMTNTASITKTGAGTLTLNATNTYTGVTTVNAGTVDLDGSINSSREIVINRTAGANVNTNGRLLIDAAGTRTLGNTANGTGDVIVGDTSFGYLQHGAANPTSTAATSTIGRDLIVGRASGGSGLVDVNNGTILNVTNQLRIGNNVGTGIVNVSAGGTLNVNGNTTIIDSPVGPNFGTLNIAGAYTDDGDVIVGQNATGIVNQTGGSASINDNLNNTGNLILGQSTAGSLGTYALSNGTLHVHGSNNMTAGTAFGNTNVGVAGRGIVNQTGGTFLNDSNMTVGGAVAGSQFNLSGTGVLNFRDRVAVTQAVATDNAASTLTVGVNGDFNLGLLPGGTLMNVTTIDVTSAPGSIFQQDGGRFVVGVDGGLAIRDGIGLDASRAMTTIVGGSYDQNGGTLAIDIFGKRIRTIGGEPIGPTDPGSNPITGLITDSDLLYIANGNATLDGTLAINLNGVKPGPLAWYDVLVANQIFVEDGFNVMGLDVWRIIPDPTTPGRQILQVATPEPASIALWSLAAVVVGGAIVVRRRKA